MLDRNVLMPQHLTEQVPFEAASTIWMTFEFDVANLRGRVAYGYIWRRSTESVPQLNAAGCATETGSKF